MANGVLSESHFHELKKKFPDIDIDETKEINVSAENLIPLMEELQKNQNYCMDFLTNLTAVDYQDYFQIIYNLFSLKYGYVLTLKIKLEERENPEIPSLASLWGGSLWQEREVYDLFGINFSGYPGHPTRILLDDDFDGYPLRKDYQWESGRE